MQFPQTEQELGSTINFLKSKGASNDELKAIVTEFAAKKTAPDDRGFLGKAPGFLKTGLNALDKGLDVIPGIGTAKKALEGAAGIADKVIGNENKDFSVADVATETVQNVAKIPEAIGEGFQQAQESTARRSEVMNPIAEQKGALGEKAMKMGIGVLNTLDYASKLIGGGLSPLIDPTIKATVENLNPEAQESLNNTIQSITTKFESLTPEQQEAIRGTGLLAEALTSVVSSPALARTGKQVIQAGRQISDIVTDGAKELAQSLKTLPNMADETIENIAFKMDDLINRRKQITDREGNIIDLATEEGLATQRSQIANELSTAYFDTVDPAIQRKLLGQDDLKRQYMEQFVEGWVDPDKPSILEVGVNRLDTAVEQIEKSIKQTGNEIGDFRQKISTVKVSPDDLNPVLTNFDKELAKFGLQQKNGKIVGLPRRKTKLSQSEVSQLQQMRNDLVDIKADPTAQLIIDVRSKIDSDINFQKDRRDISSNLDGIAKSTRSDLAEVNRQVIGREQADILERYSDLNDLITDYRKSSGKGKNPEFFLKRIMTERGRVPRGVADRIFQETGIDLSADAAIINSVTRDLAPARMKSALSQEVEQANVKAGLAINALVSPESAIIQATSKGLKNWITKYFSKDKDLRESMENLMKNDDALLELRKAMQSSDVDVKGYSNTDEAVQTATDFKKAGSAESALIEEAKRYKTADEFVKAQGTPVYRGGIKLSDEKITNAGISVSTGKNVAEDFAKQKGGKVEEIVISPTAKIIDYSDVPNVKFKNLNDYSPELDIGNKQIWKDLEVEYQKAVNWATGNGYDGVKLPLEGETRIINKDVIKTKSQLKQIWEEANK